jgi:two-component system sensor histidine kinase DevS
MSAADDGSDDSANRNPRAQRVPPGFSGRGRGRLPVTAAESGHTVEQEATYAIDVALILDAAPDGTLLVDGDGTIRYANRRLAELFGLDEQHLIGQPVELLLPDALRAGHVQHRAQFVDNPHRRSMGAGLQLAARRGDGTTFPVEVSLAPLITDDGVIVIASVRDVSDRLTADFALREARESLILAEERTRIAQDLHDTVIQRIFAAGLSLQSSLHLPIDVVRDRVLRVVDELDATIRELRTAIFELNAERAGLRVGDELTTVIAETTASLARPANVSIGEVDGLPGRIARELVPSVREALSNAVRHSRAEHVTVEVQVAAGMVTLRVADDGVGIAESAPPGRGLANLRSRAVRLGGACSISSGVGTGTVVEWSVPVALDPDRA